MLHLPGSSRATSSRQIGQFGESSLAVVVVVMVSEGFTPSSGSSVMVITGVGSSEATGGDKIDSASTIASAKACESSTSSASFSLDDVSEP